MRAQRSDPPLPRPPSQRVAQAVVLVAQVMSGLEAAPVAPPAVAAGQWGAG